MATMKDKSPMLGSRWTLVFLCWLITLASTLGSLFFSEIMNLEPCVLCWYQRIAMFPLVIILAVGLHSQDPHCLKYAFPIACIGWAIALYHFLLYSGFIPQGLQPCGKGSPCTQVQLELAGFVTIPVLSLLAFSMIVTLLIASKKGLVK